MSLYDKGPLLKGAVFFFGYSGSRINKGFSPRVNELKNPVFRARENETMRKEIDRDFRSMMREALTLRSRQALAMLVNAGAN